MCMYVSTLQILFICNPWLSDLVEESNLIYYLCQFYICLNSKNFSHSITYNRTPYYIDLPTTKILAYKKYQWIHQNFLLILKLTKNSLKLKRGISLIRLESVDRNLMKIKRLVARENTSKEIMKRQIKDLLMITLKINQQMMT